MSKSEIEFAAAQAERLAKLICEAHSKLSDEYLLNDNILTYAQKLEYEADHLIANGVTIPKWIPVEERLPKGAKAGEISENVIVHTTDGDVTTGWLDALGSDKWWLVIGTDDSHTCWGLGYVTHWMPLPEPPKEENDG